MAIAQILEPMRGWNSFDCYGIFANERVLLENLEVFRDRLKPHGYEYFVLDAGWYSHFPIAPGDEFPKSKKSIDTEIDEYGRVVALPSLFPNGMKFIADKVHEAGCKFGIHIMRGIPRKAVEINTPIKGTDYHARDIANTEDVCPWNEVFYGVNTEHPGAQAYYDSMIEVLVGYEVDFIKADDLTPFPAEVHAIADAIEKAPREIALSLSPGNDITPLNLDAYRRSNMFRITGDVWDDPKDFQKIMDRWYLYQDANTPNCRIDLDMIPFGALQVYAQEAGSDGDEALLAGKGFKRMSNFTTAQKQFFITMLAIATSPMMFGGELTMTDDESFQIVTHPEVLACNANNVCGKQVYFQNYIDIRTTPDATAANAGWVGIFNRKTVARHMSFAHSDMGIPESINTVHSIWDDRDLTFRDNKLDVFCPGQSVIFLNYGRS
jgi:hypothetical protein